MENTLKPWLTQELKKRGWSGRELGRRAGISQPVAARILTGSREAGADACVKIAMALDEPPEKLLRLAGILPPIPASDDDPITKEGLEILRSLTEERRKLGVDLLRFLYQRDEE